MSKRYELTPEGLLSIEINRSVQDARLIFHSLRRYAASIKKNAICFKKNGDVIFIKVHKRR